MFCEVTSFATVYPKIKSAAFSLLTQVAFLPTTIASSTSVQVFNPYFISIVSFSVITDDGGFKNITGSLYECKSPTKSL